MYTKKKKKRNNLYNGGTVIFEISVNKEAITDVAIARKGGGVQANFSWLTESVKRDLKTR